MTKPHQFQQIANGIKRVKVAAIYGALSIAIMTATEEGTFYSKRYGNH